MTTCPQCGRWHGAIDLCNNCFGKAIARHVQRRRSLAWWKWLLCMLAFVGVVCGATFGAIVGLDNLYPTTRN